MAFGDPMVLDTRYNWNLSTLDNFDTMLIGGKFDSSALAADGISPIGWGVSYDLGTAHAMVAGARTGGSGVYFYRVSQTSPGIGTNLVFSQEVRLNGNERYAAHGHSGRQFTFTIWAVHIGTGTVTIQLSLSALQENLVTTVAGDTVNGSVLTLTGTWTKYTLTVTPASALTAAYEVLVMCATTVNGTYDLQFDEAEFVTAYTFAVNAAMPDAPRITVPGRAYQRTVGNRLLRHRSRAGNAAKHEYDLNFGLIGLAQLQALRSLWLLDTPLRWQPNLPHLPAAIAVMMTDDFDLRMRSPSVNSNNYSGSLRLTEF